MKTIKLTDEQFETLKNLLEYEIDQEYNYQVNGDCEADYLSKIVDIYEAIHHKQATSFIEGFVISEVVEGYRKLVEEIRGLKDEQERANH